MNKVILFIVVVTLVLVSCNVFAKIHTRISRVNWLKDAAAAQETYYQKYGVYADSFDKLGIKYPEYEKYTLSGCPEATVCLMGKRDYYMLGTDVSKGYRFETSPKERGFHLKIEGSPGVAPVATCMLSPHGKEKSCLAFGATRLEEGTASYLSSCPLDSFDIPL